MYLEPHGLPFELASRKYIQIILLHSNTKDSRSGFYTADCNLQQCLALVCRMIWIYIHSVSKGIYGTPSQETAIVRNQPNLVRVTTPQKKRLKWLLMLTTRKDDDGEMKWWQKKFKKVVKSLLSIFIYIKRYMDCNCGYVVKYSRSARGYFRTIADIHSAISCLYIRQLAKWVTQRKSVSKYGFWKY